MHQSNLPEPFWKLCEEQAPAAAQAILDSWDTTEWTLSGHFGWVEFDDMPTPPDYEQDTLHECYRIWRMKLTAAMLNLLGELVKGKS